MPKLKTKKTLSKRIRITKGGKIVKKQSNIGHLKVKWDSARRGRKANRLSQKNKGHIKMIKRLMGKAGRNIK